MKTRIITLLSILWVSCSVTGQEWIGKQFTLDTMVNLQCVHQPKNLNLLKSRIQDNAFYFVEQQGYQYKDNDYQAVIHKLSLDNYDQTEIILPLPVKLRKPEHQIRNLWIYDFCFEGVYLLVTTQETLILYKQDNNQNYQVESTFSHHNLYMGYLYQNKMYFFEEDHDRGFKWFQQDLDGGSATLVRELPYEAPHIVQIQPNRYISHNQQSVFFLSTRFPRLETYSLDGQPQDTVVFDIPFWKAFEDDYIQMTLSTPYGIERIFTVKDDLFSYSYPKAVMPVNGDLLLFFMHYDTIKGKSVLQYGIRETSGSTVLYAPDLHEDSTYVAAQFPFTLFKDGLDKANASGEGVIAQLTLNANVPWEGKTHKEYSQDVNRFFLNDTPSLSYKIMRYKPSSNSCLGEIHTVSQESIKLSDLPAKKSVLILHQDLECSGCVNALYQLLNHTETYDTHIGQVYPRPLNGLATFELKNRIGQHLMHPFSLYYCNSPEYKDLGTDRILREKDFPCVLFCDKKGIRKWFTASDIFSTNLNATEFSRGFLDDWQSFFSEE